MESSFLLQNDCRNCDEMRPSCLQMREIKMTILSEGQTSQIHKNVPLSWKCCHPLTVMLPFSSTGWNVTIIESLGPNLCRFHSRVKSISINGIEISSNGEELSRSGILDSATFTFHKPFSCACKLVVQFHCHDGPLLIWGEMAVEVVTKNEGVNF